MQVKEKKKPERTCLGCSSEKPKNELLRIVRTPEGEICLDLTGKKAGRGAYICKDPECLKKARKTKRLERGLNSQIPDDVYERLENEVINNG